MSIFCVHLHLNPLTTMSTYYLDNFKNTTKKFKVKEITICELNEGMTTSASRWRNDHKNAR